MQVGWGLELTAVGSQAHGVGENDGEGEEEEEEVETVDGALLIGFRLSGSANRQGATGLLRHAADCAADERGEGGGG